MTTLSENRMTFTPGEYWTPERIAVAAARHREMRQSPNMIAVMDAIGQAAQSEHDPASMAAALSGVDPKGAVDGAIDRDACLFRRGRTSDTGALQQLIVSGDLPPFFVEPFVEGFLVVEHEGEIIGCGGNEHFGDAAVIRSVVVHERARGLGLGIEIARLLIEDARASGATDLYLFTLEAYEFWKRLGFVDLELSKWPQPTHEQWQYAFIVTYPEAASDVHRMWRPAAQ